jgi:glycosyltransferase involved in cell wall biosynthesis
MKIAIVTNSFTRARLELFERTAESYGHSITIFKGADWWWKKSRNLIVNESKSFHINIPLRSGGLYVQFDLRAINAISKDYWDLIIAYGYGTITTLMVALLSKARHIPFVVFSDARFEYEQKRSLIIKLAKKSIHMLASGFIASGQSSKLAFRAMGVRKEVIHVVPYAINNKRIYDEYLYWKSREHNTRNELGLSLTSLILLFVGRINRNKGIFPLLRAFRKISERNHRVELLLVGKMELTKKEQSLANSLVSERVRFAGPIEHEEIAKYYAIADVVILPSLTDVWGLVINEAMACGLPVVASKEAGAVRDLVLGGENGLVIKPDAEGIFSALERITSDDSKLPGMGIKARQIIADYDMGISTNLMQSLLLKYVNR